MRRMQARDGRPSGRPSESARQRGRKDDRYPGGVPMAGVPAPTVIPAREYVAARARRARCSRSTQRRGARQGAPLEKQCDQNAMANTAPAASRGRSSCPRSVLIVITRYADPARADRPREGSPQTRGDSRPDPESPRRNERSCRPSTPAVAVLEQPAPGPSLSARLWSLRPSHRLTCEEVANGNLESVCDSLAGIGVAFTAGRNHDICPFVSIVIRVATKCGISVPASTR